MISARLKAFAVTSALLTMLLSLVAPLCIYGLVTGAALSDDVPPVGLWLVILGGAVGAGAAHVVFRFVLIRYGQASDAEVAAIWEGKK